MKLNRLLGALCAGLMLFSLPVAATEQLTTVLPIAGPMSMAIFAGKANDAHRAMMSCSWGPSAPANGPSAAPIVYQCWADTTTNPVVFKRYDGASWAIFGKLNTSTHVWTPSYQGTDLGTASIATTGTSGHTLGFLDGANTWSGVQSFNDGDLGLKGSSSGLGKLHAPAAASTYDWTLPAATGTLADLDLAQTFTNKTLTTPTVNGGTLAAITGFGLRSTGASFDLRFATSEVLTADRILSWVLGDAARSITLAGNLSYGGAFTMSGAFGFTGTVTGTTAVTFPTAGTLATLGGTESLSNKTLVTPILGVATGTTLALNGCTIGAAALCSTGNIAITSAGANALDVGPNGTTNPTLQVDPSTASAATGIKIKSAAAGSGVAISTITSGTNEALAIDAAGGGAITLGGVSTGAIVLTRATNIQNALSYGGVTLSNSVTGTGSMALSVSPAFTGTPTVPTAAPGTNTTQSASTAFVTAAVAASTTGVSSFNGSTGAITTSVTQQKFTATGTYTPTTGMKYAIIECQGPGAGGGGMAGAVGSGGYSGSGGAGGYSRILVTAATVGASKSVTVGTGGAGGTAGANNGTAGSGATSVGTLCVGNAGSGGGGGTAGSSIGVAGTGGAAGTGDLSIPGASGNAGVNLTITTVALSPPSGPNSVLGVGGASRSTSGAGNNASGFGGGGGAALENNNAVNVAGGNGSDGVVYITEFVQN